MRGPLREFFQSEEKMEFRTESDGKNGKISQDLNGEEVGHLTFIWDGEDKFVITEVYTDEKFRGRGLAKKLVEKSADYAREKNAKIIPVCPYARHVMERGEAFRDVLY